VFEGPVTLQQAPVAGTTLRRALSIDIDAIYNGAGILRRLRGFLAGLINCSDRSQNSGSEQRPLLTDPNNRTAGIRAWTSGQRVRCENYAKVFTRNGRSYFRLPNRSF